MLLIFNMMKVDFLVFRKYREPGSKKTVNKSHANDCENDLVKKNHIYLIKNKLERMFELKIS